MKFVDYVKINLRSGSGGNGCASFRREKFIPRGGPDGGSGGNGGAILFQGTKGKTTLLDFQFRQHFHAPNGTAGVGNDKHGRNGEPLVLKVPLGTIVQEVGLTTTPSAQGQSVLASGGAKDTQEVGLEFVRSPMVGTFYAAPAPDVEPYITQGQEVNEGDVICIIEAMKLMNEIKSELKGRIVEILVQNGQPVEFDQPLFKIQKL